MRIKGGSTDSTEADVKIEDISVRAIIGIHPYERKKKQKLKITIEYTYDMTLAAESDNISAAVDYDGLAKTVAGIAEKSSYHLVETLVSEILKHVLSVKGIIRASVTVQKPAALKFARAVSVTALFP